MSTSTKTILIMAGGTGGHVFPALAVAEVLRANAFRVIWLGTRQGIEARLVPAAGIDIEWLPVGGLRGKSAVTLLLAPLKLLRAGYHAWRVLRRVRPAAVLGMGGFASGPGGAIAWLMRRPLVVHEQNAIAGFTNRLLARIAKRALVAFPATLDDISREEVVGNPVRDAVSRMEAPERRFATRDGALRVLVLGGSLGARALNENVPPAVGTMTAPVEVLHQCGRGDADDVRARYRQAGVAANVSPFIEDMAEAYAWADVAICRAGAMTVFELAAAGLGAVLVPYPYAVDDHQTANSKYLVDAGAAVLLQERDMTVPALGAVLRDLADRGRLLDMARKARSRARPDATRAVADVCMALAMQGEAA